MIEAIAALALIALTAAIAVGDTSIRDGESVATLLESPTSLAADPERLIQTEVIVPAGAERSPAAAIRLLVTIVVFGVLFGIGIIAATRAIEFLFRAIFGG